MGAGPSKVAVRQTADLTRLAASREKKGIRMSEAYDSDVDEETIARERAALQAATSDTGQPQPLLLPAPRPAASSAGAPNNVHRYG